MSTPTSTTPVRDLWAAEVMDGDTVVTEEGDRLIAAAVHLDGVVHLFYRVPGGVGSLELAPTANVTIRAAVVS